MVTLEEKLDKIRSPNLENQQQTALVLGAVESTLQEQNTAANPTSYFAALIALLGQAVDSNSNKKDLTTSIVYLLDVVTAHVPQSLLRAKFTQILSLLAQVLSQDDADAPLIRPSVGCLETLLLAQDSPAWALSAIQVSPRRAVSGLLKLALDHRPKVRKKAQEALKKILQNPPPSPSLDHPAAVMCAETALQSLAELAERAKQSAKESKSTEALQTPDLLHALQLVKTIASASGGWPNRKIESLCELLLGVARSGNEHMTMAVFEIFEMILEGIAADETSSLKLRGLLEIISELRPSSDDTRLLPPWIAILCRVSDVSAQIEPEDTFQRLPELFVMVSQFLESQSKHIRISASECLVSFLTNCIPRQVLLEMSVYEEKIIEKLVEVVEKLLSVKYQAALPETFSVIGALFDALRWRASPCLLGVVRTIGRIRGNIVFTGKREADEVLGKAIRAMGPDAVLSVLPLNLDAPAKGEQGRAWLLPLLRDYTTNTSLAHFKAEFVPLSMVMFQRVIDCGRDEKSMEVKIYETIVQQIWSILPGYCDLPLDLRQAFDEPFAILLARLLYQQVDLRLDICRALKSVIESNQSVASIEDDDDLVSQSRVSKDDARRNLKHIGTFAGNLLAALFNVYCETLPQTRGPILQTISALLSITPMAQLVATFEDVCKRLVPALQETSRKEPRTKAQPSAEQLPSLHTLLDLVVTMSIYLPRESYGSLFEVANLVLLRDDDAQLQKKAYKLVPRLAKSPVGRAALAEKYAELQEFFLSNAERVLAPARRDRLLAIAALVPLLPNASLHLIPALLSEVVISCKEHNERSRETAFELLVVMGKKMASATGTVINNSLVPHMPEDAPVATASIEEFFTMVSAGLAGSTPHMISASIVAITRILYEFRESLSTATVSDIVQTMDLFLTSNNREIVKSVLGFVKVSVISLPTDMMQSRLATLMPNLMIWSHEHKGHFRAKVKHIVERMVRRFGAELVTRFCPEEDRKLITNIRKAKERNKKRKNAAKAQDDDVEMGDQHPGKEGGRFESEYDRVLYSSEDSDDSRVSDVEESLEKHKKGGSKGGDTYIIEEAEEPLDLLSRNALAHISSTKPAKAQRSLKSRTKVDLDGKLILGQIYSDEDTMDMDVPGDGEEGSGVGAYVTALRGRDVPKRGLRGKLKFSNRRDRRDDDEDKHENGVEIDKSTVSTLKTYVGGGDRGKLKSRELARGRDHRSGRGGIATARQGLGQDKKRDVSIRNRVSKSQRGRR